MPLNHEPDLPQYSGEELQECQFPTCDKMIKLRDVEFAKWQIGKNKYAGGVCKECYEKIKR